MSIEIKYILRVSAVIAVLCGSVSCRHKMEVDYSPWYKDMEGPDIVEDGPNTIKVMSFNVRNYAQDAGTEHSWDLRKPGIAAMLNNKRPMVIGTQECYISQMNDITNACPQYGSYGVGRDNGLTSGEATAILYLKDSLSLNSKGTFWLSETPTKPSQGWDSSCKRVCSWALFTVKSTGQQFYFFNTHLDHVGPVAKEFGLRLVWEKMASMNTKGLPMFLTGDMNAKPEYEIFAESPYLDARATATKSDNFGSSNGYRESGHSIIDYIFYTEGLKAQKFETIRDRWDGVQFISDHYPVMCVFKYGEEQ